MFVDWMGLIAQGLAVLVGVSTFMWRLARAQEDRLMQNLDQRFEAERKQRRISDAHIEAMLDQNKMESRNNEKDLQKVQRELLELKAELPRTFVFRDDYVRGQTVIEAKLDALATRIENQQLKKKGDTHA